MKGVIVAAGYGTRFLPVTKTIPKEMLPLFDKPLIDFILDEFEEAGIEDVIVITSRRKKALEDYLDREVELELELKKGHKEKLLERIQSRRMNFCFIRQQEMKGTGHALLLLKPVINNEPFVVAYPDDIVLSTPGLSSNMISLYYKSKKSILAVREEENVSRYGVVKLRSDSNLIEKIVEKPPVDKAPSNLVSIGRYLFNSEILDLLEELYKKHREGEFYHIGAINKMAEEGMVIAYKTEGIILDTGEIKSYALSWLKYLQNHPEGKTILEKFIHS